MYISVRPLGYTGSMQARFLSYTDESTDIRTFRFQTAAPLDHIAGQFLEMTLPHPQPDSRGTMRQFTISSSPSEPELAITVNFARAHSSYKQALRQLQPGAEAMVSEPLGDFVLPLDESTPLIWAAGGIGITPFRSIAKWLVDNGQTREITMFHSVRNRDEALFAELMHQAGVGRRQVITTSDAAQTRLQAATILPTINQQAEALVYISGPQAMVEALVRDLRQHGVDHQRIITDAFLGYDQ
jgi:ferredoxin-NADP reductase